MKPMKPMRPMEPMQPMKPMEPMRMPDPWWPADYGTANAAGGQNDVRYAYFGERRLLIVERDGKAETYATGDHQITGIAQAQGDRSQLTFSSQNGPVSLATLKRVDA